MTLAAVELGRSREAAQIVSSTSRLMGKNDHDMDQDARDSAKEAIFKIASHEEVCTQRWEQAKQASIRLEAALSDLKKAVEDRIGKVPAAIIAGLTGIIGFLSARAFPPH